MGKFWIEMFFFKSFVSIFWMFLIESGLGVIFLIKIGYVFFVWLISCFVFCFLISLCVYDFIIFVMCVDIIDGGLIMVYLNILVCFFVDLLIYFVGILKVGFNVLIFLIKLLFIFGLIVK